MNGPFTISRLLLFVAMGGLIALSFLAVRVLERDVQAYRQSNQEAIHWSAAQVEVELSRFLLTLNRYGRGDADADHARVMERFDILWSRTGLFRSGQVGQRLRQADEGLGAIPLMVAKLQQHEEAVLNIARNDAATHALLMAEFEALQGPLRRLSVKVLANEQERYAAVRTTLMDSSRMTFWVWASTLVLAALLVGVMFLEARRYRRTIRETAALAHEAQVANQAKSRFLTMMSHELRTPMNGVMGLMALAKQSGLSDKQLRLIDQAERSGAQMVGLLGDILDFSDLQSQRLDFERTPFQPELLVSNVRQVLTGLRNRTAIAIDVECPPSVPEWVEGDFPRLRQILVHLCTYFVETVGAQELVLRVGHGEGSLVIELEIDAKEVDEPGWQPEAIFGRQSDDYGEFASDSVGPTIARGLLEMMGGSLRMRRNEAGRASLFVDVPAREVLPVRDCVRIEAQSDTTALLLHASIAEDRWTIWSPRLSANRVATVIVEAGDFDEGARVAALRQEHRGARIVAVGAVSDVKAFDAVCALPFSAASLTEVLECGHEELQATGPQLRSGPAAG